MEAEVRRQREREEADPGGELPAALRAAAARAVELCGGAVLLFGPGQASGPPRLRSAAGVPSAAAARAVADTIGPAVREAVESGAESRLGALAELGAVGRAGTRILPLRCAGRVHGALVVGVPAELAPDAEGALARLAEEVGLRFEYSRVVAEANAYRARLDERERLAEEKSDEILKLSEQLFAQDIELLRKDEKLGKIEKLKNDFIEKMSRELRTPLNAIIEAIIAVLSGESEVLSESAQRTLRAALDDGTAFLRTLQNILELWRIKQGELAIEVQEVNFREVVEEAIFSVQDELEGKPVAIEKRLEEPFPRIRTDLAKINQLLFLLLDNAVKFTPEGTIEIRARVAEGRLACEIRDSGIGICADDQQFIFDEFFQVDELASTKYRGSGLGLALVRDLLILLDGQISVSSDAGNGSVFRFEIPVQVAA